MAILSYTEIIGRAGSHSMQNYKDIKQHFSLNNITILVIFRAKLSYVHRKLKTKQPPNRGCTFLVIIFGNCQVMDICIQTEEECIKTVKGFAFFW